MVFKRRDRRPVGQAVIELIYPRGGWGRAMSYVNHRLRRLPGTPETIARGIWAGVFTTFTPFYGLHFFVAAIIARLMRGNILAALLATFFGNPLTYVPIAVVSLQTGHFLLGTNLDEGMHRSLGGKFFDAAGDLKHNLYALFSSETADWANLLRFYDEVFFPYMIGGMIPGVIAGTVAYYVSVPLIRAYQNRRTSKIKKKIEAIKKKAARQADEARHLD